MRLALVLAIAGCARHHASPQQSPDASSVGATPDAPTAASPCGPNAVPVANSFCIDQYEGALEERQLDGTWRAASPYETVGTRVVRAVPAAGITPQAYISGVEAEAACKASGKRLCTSTEWLTACRGPDDTIYPYGNTHVDGACNDAYAGSPVVNFFHTSTGVWDMPHMNDPGIDQMPNTVFPGGAFEHCVSAWGAFDMHGNLHEWTVDPTTGASGGFRGGFFADAKINGPGCTYVTTAHAFAYHDYSTGFRCCSDLRK